MIFFIIAIIVLLRVSVWNLPFVRDGFGYAYVGSRIAQGAVLYKDVWDHKPPGVYFLDALLYNIVPNDYLLGIRIISIIVAILASFFLYKLLQHFFSKKISFFATLLFSIFTNIYMVTQGDNMVETYMVLIMVLVYYFFTKAIRSKLNINYFLAGICVGFLFVFKQVGILPLLAMVLFMVYIKEKIVKYIVLFCGFISVILPIVVYFYVNNALFEAFEQIFLYNFFYSGQGYSASSIAQSMYYFLQVFLATFLFWFLALYGVLRKKFKRIDILFLMFFLFSFIGTALGGKFAFSRNYFLLVFPSLAYFVAYAINELYRKFSKGSVYKKSLLLGALFLFLPSMILQAQTILSGFYFNGTVYLKEREAMYSLGLPNYNFVKDEKTFYTIAHYIDGRVQNDSFILDWGAEPELYLLTQTHAPTRYFYSFPINGVFIKDNRVDERRKTFMKEIQENKPIYVITNNREERYKSSFENLGFPDFKKFILDNYMLEKSIDNYFIFKLRNT